jgi:serine acetyltransferase
MPCADLQDMGVHIWSSQDWELPSSTVTHYNPASCGCDDHTVFYILTVIWLFTFSHSLARRRSKELGAIRKQQVASSHFGLHSKFWRMQNNLPNSLHYSYSQKCSYMTRNIDILVVHPKILIAEVLILAIMSSFVIKFNINIITDTLCLMFI